MSQVNYRFNSSQIPVLADQILARYKQDKLYFEHYSPIFNQEFLNQFEENVNLLANQSPSGTMQDHIVELNGKIKRAILSFDPLIKLTEIYVRRNYPITGLRVADFSIANVKEALTKQCIWEIRRNCMRLISQLESKLDDFIDQGFLSILIGDFHHLISKLNGLEAELAESTHQLGILTDEYRQLDNHVKNLINTIIESTPAVFGDDDSGKKEEYSIEKLMTKSQFNRSEPQ